MNFSIMVFICFHVVLCLFFLSGSFGRMFFLYFGRKSEFETRCWVDKLFFLFNRLLSCCCYMTYGVLKFFKLYSSCPPKALESWELLDFF